MTCPTCDHTLEGIGDVPAVGGRPLFWCPRCGTIQWADEPPAVPKLVERCRQLEARHALDKLHADQDWHALGIRESINRPEDRP